MKVIDFTPVNVYSCQYCQKELESDKILVIYEKVSPVCSDYCFFMVVYNILSKYSKEQLSALSITFEIPEYSSKPINTQIYEYSKRYKKLLLSYINKEVINYHNAV